MTDARSTSPQRVPIKRPRFFGRLLHTWRRFAELRRASKEIGAAENSAQGRRPLISVMLITFNHGRYISQALDSILMQQGDFDLAINVIDDASTDDTQKIARDYARRFAGIVHCFFNAYNVGHVATQINTYRGFQSLRGKYFALLEGDDYWTDSHKLQKQIDFLEKHPTYVACGHDTLKVYEDGSKEPEHFLPFKAFGRDTATIGDLVGLAAVFHLSSLVYRNVFGGKPPLCLADPFSCETTINMVYGQYGDFYHMPGYMSVYRAHSQGVFSTRRQESIWRFHLIGFDRFALYLGWRYWYWFMRSMTGFCQYVLSAHRRGVGPRLQITTKLMFASHLVVSVPAYGLMQGIIHARRTLRSLPSTFAPIFVRRPRRWLTGVTVDSAISLHGAVYNRLVDAAPDQLLRTIVRLEDKWPLLRRLRRKWKPSQPSRRTQLSALSPTMNQSQTQQQVSYQIETTASPSQVDSRKRLLELFERSPLPMEDRLFNIGMYVRSSVLVKFLVMSEMYERIKNLPGCLVEFGTWWGQNLVLLENLRAIHEPFNKQRVIVGFDTFSGYTDRSENDRESAVWKEQSYSTGKGYVSYLKELLEAHEGSNVLGHVRGKHELIEGDVELTAPKYFGDRPQLVVAFAYFDMALYRPTKAALSAIKPHLIPGSVLLLDEFTWAESPGEAIAFREVFSVKEVRLEKCALYPSKTIATVI